MSPLDKTIQSMTDSLVKEFSPEKVILFGSHAWGAPNQSSDIDLLVILTHSDERIIARMQRARRALRSFQIPKDILVKTRQEFDRFSKVYASLEAKIVEKGIVLYG